MEADTDWPMRNIAEPHEENDVLVGSGQDLFVVHLQEHPGNARLWKRVEGRTLDYASRTRLEKPIVALEILQQWREQVPPGRFLKCNDDSALWYDIGDKKARELISRALRTSMNNKENEEKALGVEKIAFKEKGAIGRNTSNEETINSTVGLAMKRRISTQLNYGREGKLFGRSDEQTKMEKIFYRLKEPDSQSTDFVLISGESGAGKTALARSLRTIVVQEGGFFVEGKFEQLESSEPFSAIKNVFTELTNLLMELHEEDIAVYREAILKAVENECTLLTNMGPGMATLLGPHEELVVEAGQGGQAPKRLEYVCRMFLRAVVTSQECPLVILLDDLHWANRAELDFLASIVTDAENRGMLFLGTYQSDKLANTQRLNELLIQFDLGQVKVHRIELDNLGEDVISSMLAQSLSLEADEVRMLGKTLFSITKGNACFLLELLRSLQNDDLLRFDEDTMQWICDGHMIRVYVEVGTIRDLFRAKIMELPSQVQETLKIASCFSLKLEQSLLKLIVSEAVSSHLEVAASKGLLTFDETRQRYAFAHDDAKEAAYGLIAADERDAYHLGIGYKLWQKLTSDELDGCITVVSRQLILGERLIADENEKSALASLCFRTAEQAIKKSADFQSASVHLQHGISLLGNRKWRDNYDLALRLYNSAAEVCYCCAQFEKVGEFVAAVLDNARSFEDTLQVRSTKIYTLGATGRLPEAIEDGLATLRDLGEKLPPNPSAAQVSLSLWRTKRLLRSRSDEQLLRLPSMTDTKKIASMQILNLIFLYALYARPLLAPLLAMRMVRLTVEHGTSAVACVGFSCFGMILCGGGSSIGEGYHYGNLGMEMYNAFRSEAWLPRVSATFYGCVWPWKEPIKPSLEPLKQAYRVGLATGDIEYAALNASIYCWNSRDSLPLPVLENEIRLLAERMEFMGQSALLLLLKPLAQMIHCFSGRARGDCKILTGDIMDHELTVAEAVDSNPSMLVWTRFHCLILAYFFSDYTLAADYAVGSHQIYDSGYGAMDSAIVLFYECMALLADRRNGRRGRIAYVRRRLKRLRTWAKHSPLNFLGKQYLLEAELAIATGDKLSALSKYTSSILLSREGGFLMQEALANERTAKYFVSQGDRDLAIPYFREAYRLYKEWGGTEKMRHLKEEDSIDFFTAD